MPKPNTILFRVSDVVNNIVLVTWFLLSIIFAIHTINKYIISHWLDWVIFIFVFGIIDTIVLRFFAFASPNFNTSISNVGLFWVTHYFAELLAFNLFMLMGINTRNKYILWLAIGFSVGMACQFMFSSIYVYNDLKSLGYAELLWLVSLLIIMISMIKIIKMNNYEVSNWFKKTTSLNSKLAFWVFVISIVSFLIPCIILEITTQISKWFFIWFPTISMLFSLMATFIAIRLAINLEKPFILLKNEIQSLFDGNKSTIRNFDILEFQELNKFIIESYEYKTFLEKHIVSTATRIAHDIRSPIQIIDNLIKNSGNCDYNTLKAQITKQINKINYISKSVLKENKKIIESDSYGYQSLYCIIDELIQDKYIEWNIEDKIIDFIYKPQQIIWLDNNQSKVKIVLSNLLNNSYEASKKTQLKIILSVELIDNFININLEDFGIGIDEKYLSEIYAGKSFKINGNGLGLSSAKEFMCSITGNLLISSKINHGTNVKLTFSKTSFQEQFAKNIDIRTSHIVIVDDNTEIIYFWQQFFLFKNKFYELKPEFFVNYRSFIKYLKVNDTSGITYLLNYSISGESLTGLDVIRKYNLENVYLITDDAEDVKLQDDIKNTQLKLIPKSMLNILKENNGIIINAS